MNRTTVYRSLALVAVLGAVLALTLLLQLGTTRAQFERVDATSYVDVTQICHNRLEFGLALADADGDDTSAIYQAYYVDKTPAISVTIIATATIDALPTQIVSQVVALPRIDEPPLVISYTPGITPATYLYARTDLTAEDPQYVTGTLPDNGNIVFALDESLISGTEIVLGFAPTDSVSPTFAAFTYPQTGTLEALTCLSKVYLPLIQAYGESPPRRPSNPAPADGAEDQQVSLDLSWTGGDPDGDVVTYTVHLEAGNPAPETLACSAVTTTTCTVAYLDYSTDYYWQVVAEDETNKVTEGPVWAFATGAPVSTPPFEPSDPFPEDAVTDVPTQLTLGWQGGDPDGDQVTYDVYFEAETLEPSLLACEGVEDTLCAVGPLSQTTDYFWQVVATDEYGTHTRGPLWEFTTGGIGWITLMTEDFDGYFPNPAKWTIGDNNGPVGGFYDWVQSDCRAFESDMSGWPIGGGDDGKNLRCGDNYPDEAASWMVHGPISLEGAEDAQLNYQTWLNTDSDWDSICHYASINGKDFHGSCSTLASPQMAWHERTLDLTNVNVLGDLRGQEKVWIVLAFESDDSGNKPEGAYIDDVLLRMYVSSGPSLSSSDAAPTAPGDRPSSITLDW